jgi:nucleoside-diphosphate-sugar epimerase
MRIFLAGATGAIGRRLVPLLVGRGHEVVATTRTNDKAHGLRAMGAQPVVVDGLNRPKVMEAVLSAKPDVIVHQMTSLANLRNLRKFDKTFAMTNRLRTEGTQYLLDAAQTSGVRKFLAQSYTGWPNIREGSRVKSEDDPLDPNPPKSAKRTFDAIRQLETSVARASSSRLTGIILRYGSFYGPGSQIADDGTIVEMVRRRKFPIVGDGAGVWSFIHVDDAANATRLAIEGAPAGTYNIVDDDPAEVSTWLPYLADAIGAKRPYHLPTWIGQLAIGEAGVSMMTRVRGSSNEKAKRALGWTPTYSSWRDGFRNGLSGEAPRRDLEAG